MSEPPQEGDPSHPGAFPLAVSPPAVHHVAVLVTDLERAEAFYGGILGLPVLRRWSDDSGAPRSVWFSLGGKAFLAVERAAPDVEPRPSGGPGFHCLVLAMHLTDRAAVRAHFARAGIAIVRETPFTLFVRDPEGNLLGVSHYPNEAGA